MKLLMINKYKDIGIYAFTLCICACCTLDSSLNIHSNTHQISASLQIFTTHSMISSSREEKGLSTEQDMHEVISVELISHQGSKLPL